MSASNHQAEPPEVYSSIGVTGGDRETRYWAFLIRDGAIERKCGPFKTLAVAVAAFLPVKVWPKPLPPPRG